MKRKGQNGNSWKLGTDHPLFVAEANGPYDAGAPKKGLRTVSVRRPGQKGTLQALREFGDRLVCVRYLKDGIRCKRYKTVEIIIHEEDWTPPAKASRRANGSKDVVSLRLPMAAEDLRAKVWAAGGRWDPAAKVWTMSYRTARQLGLENNIVKRRPNAP